MLKFGASNCTTHLTLVNSANNPAQVETCVHSEQWSHHADRMCSL